MDSDGIIKIAATLLLVTIGWLFTISYNKIEHLSDRQEILSQTLAKTAMQSIRNEKKIDMILTGRIKVKE